MILLTKSKPGKSAMVVAVDCLSRRSMTHYELETRLLEKGFESSEVTGVLDRLLKLGYLNDQEFALMYSESRLKRYSKRRVQQDMKMRGLDPCLIEQALESTYSDVDEYQQCLTLAKRWWVEEGKRWEQRHEAEQAKRYVPRELWIQHKVARKLIQRGYPTDLVWKALNNLEDSYNMDDEW
ncbi:regulatory protein RecX [Desulfosporosinus burensis]